MIAPVATGRSVGLAVHVANGAMFGVAFAGWASHGVRRGVLAAEAENVLLWPLTGVLDRVHPDVRAGRVAADAAESAHVRPGGARARGVRGGAGRAWTAGVGTSYLCGWRRC